MQCLDVLSENNDSRQESKNIPEDRLFENLLHVRRIEPYVWGSEPHLFSLESPSDVFPPAQENNDPNWPQSTMI